MKNKLTQSIKIIFLGAILVAGLSFAWTGPTDGQSQAPANNVRRPIDISATEQAKAGNLYIGYTTAPATPATLDIDGVTYTQELEAKMTGTTGGNIFVGNKMRISSSTGGTFPATAPALNVAAGSIKSVPLATPTHDDPLPLCATAAGKIILCSLTAACGTADGQVLASKPTTDLCYAGTASTVSGGSAGPWAWSCTDSVSGATVTCGATKTPPPTLTFSNTGNGYGRIRAAVTGGSLISTNNSDLFNANTYTFCGSLHPTSTCSNTTATFNPGTIVTFTAEGFGESGHAGESSRISSWNVSGNIISGCNTDDATCKIKMDSSITVIVRFDRTYRLGVLQGAIPAGSISEVTTVKVNSITPTNSAPTIGGCTPLFCWRYFTQNSEVVGTSNCINGFCQQNLNEGAQVTLEAVGGANSHFVRWNHENGLGGGGGSRECDESTSSTCTVTMDQVQYLIAYFTPN